MNPLVVITTQAWFADLVEPVGRVLELPVIVVPTWEEGMSIPHHMAVVYLPQQDFPPLTLLTHPAPLLICCHRGNRPDGIPATTTAWPPRYVSYMVLPTDPTIPAIDPEELAMRILRASRHQAPAWAEQMAARPSLLPPSH